MSSSSRIGVPATVQDYQSALDPARAKVLRSVLALVRKTVPGSELVISYGIPAFMSGRLFICCAAFKNHVGIYPPVKGDPTLIKALKPYSRTEASSRQGRFAKGISRRIHQ